MSDELQDAIRDWLSYWQGYEWDGKLEHLERLLRRVAYHADARGLSETPAILAALRDERSENNGN